MLQNVFSPWIFCKKLLLFLFFWIKFLKIGLVRTCLCIFLILLDASLKTLSYHTNIANTALVKYQKSLKISKKSFFKNGPAHGILILGATFFGIIIKQAKVLFGGWTKETFFGESSQIQHLLGLKIVFFFADDYSLKFDFPGQVCACFWYPWMHLYKPFHMIIMLYILLEWNIRNHQKTKKKP